MKKEDIRKTNDKKKSIIKIILYVIIIIVIYNIFIVGISEVLNKSGKSILGYKAYIIETESMEPTINAGDIVIIKQIQEENLATGDIITFERNDGVIVTHRIIGINELNEIEKEYTTKGDNNNLEDVEKVKFAQIEGRKVLTMPFFGKIIQLLQNEIYLILIIIIILLIFLRMQKSEEKNIVRREKKKEEDEKFKNKKY